MTHPEIFCYEPQSPRPVAEPFLFAAVGLAHPHIYGMCHGLIAAGGRLRYICDPDEALVRRFAEAFPEAEICADETVALSDPSVALIATAAVPSARAELAVCAMEHGKDVLVDKAPAITIAQCETVEQTMAQTGRYAFVFYGESVADEAALFAEQLVKRGVIGRVCHVESVAPHRLNAPSRAPWFFEKRHTGGLLTDLAGHHFHQFLRLTGDTAVTVNTARVACDLAAYPTLETRADITLTGSEGVTGYVRVDWLSPEGLPTWGDPRTVITGQDGYIELRKNIDLGKGDGGTVYVVNRHGVFFENVTGKVGVAFFGRVIDACRSRTADPLRIAQDWTAARLAIQAQTVADATQKNR